MISRRIVPGDKVTMPDGSVITFRFRRGGIEACFELADSGRIDHQLGRHHKRKKRQTKKLAT